MHFLGTVFLFLFLFSQLAYWRLTHFTTYQKTLSVHKKELQLFREKECEHERLLYETTVFRSNHLERPSSPISPKPMHPPKEREELLYLEYIPYNAKLNLRFITESTLPHREILERLIAKNYPPPPCSIASFIDEMIENLKKEKPSAIEDIFTFTFSSEKIRAYFVFLLQGDKHHPSLLHEVTYEAHRRKKEFNIHFTSLTLLKAILNDDIVANKIYEERKKLHEEGKRRSSGKKRALVTPLFLTEERVLSLLNGSSLHFETTKPLFDFKLPTRISLSTHRPHFIDSKGRETRR